MNSRDGNAERGGTIGDGDYFVSRDSNGRTDSQNDFMGAPSPFLEPPPPHRSATMVLRPSPRRVTYFQSGQGLWRFLVARKSLG